MVEAAQAGSRTYPVINGAAATAFTSLDSKLLGILQGSEQSTGGLENLPKVDQLSRPS